MVFVFMKGKIYYEIIKRHTRNIKELWEYWIDKKKPDKFEILGSIVVLIGIAIKMM